MRGSGYRWECAAASEPSRAALRGGESTADWDTAASNRSTCSTGNCLSKFHKGISSKSLNCQIWARTIPIKFEKFELDEGFQPYRSPFRSRLYAQFGSQYSAEQLLFGELFVFISLKLYVCSLYYLLFFFVQFVLCVCALKLSFLYLFMLLFGELWSWLRGARSFSGCYIYATYIYTYPPINICSI